LICCPKLEHHYCGKWDYWQTRHWARKAACRDIAKLKKNRCMNCDYRKGFEQAYVDVAMGADGKTPALAPAQYWKEHNRTPNGHAGARDWFNGYAAGSARAQACQGDWNKVPSSGLSGYGMEQNCSYETY